MLHKISQFCDKIDVIKQKSDKLRELKYGYVKVNKKEIDTMIEDIQHLCYIISQDKSEYKRRKK